jgi:hypothetical protein
MRTDRKDPNAVALGSKGGKARAKKMSADALSAIGKKGANARFQRLGESRRREIARKDDLATIFVRDYRINGRKSLNRRRGTLETSLKSLLRQHEGRRCDQ